MSAANRRSTEADQGSSPATERFSPIQRSPRLSDEVAETLLREVRQGSMQAGERFPSERELSEQFNVSRTVIREAIRSLAGKGVITVQPGRGLAVARVEASTVRESMSLYLQGMDQLDYEMVHEVRATIELEIAALAASRANEDEVRALSEVCERMADHPADIEFTSKADVEFHRTLATITHNPLFMIMLDAIGDVLLEIRIETMAIPGRTDKGLEAHREILTQVGAGNPDKAREAMREHLTESERLWRELGHGVALKHRRTPSKQ